MARRASRRALPSKGAHGLACGPADAGSDSDEDASPRAAEQHPNPRSSSRLRQKLGGSHTSAAAPTPRPARQSPTGAQRRPAPPRAARQTKATATRPKSTRAQPAPGAAVQPSRSNCLGDNSTTPAAAALARVAAPTLAGSRKRHAPDNVTAGSGEVQPAKRCRAGSEATWEQRQPQAEAKAEPRSSRRSGRHAAAAAAAQQAAEPGSAHLLGTAPVVGGTRQRPAAAAAAADEAGQQMPEPRSQEVGRTRASGAAEAAPAGAYARQAGRHSIDGRRGSQRQATERQAADGDAQQQSSGATPASRRSSKREAGQRVAQAPAAQPAASPAREQPVLMTSSRKTPAEGAGSVPTAAGALSPHPATARPTRHSLASHHELAAEFGVAASPQQQHQQQQAVPGSAQQTETQAPPQSGPGTCAGAVAVGASRQLYASPARQAGVPGRTAAALAHLQPDPAASAVAPAAVTVARPANSRPPACKQLVMPGAAAAASGDKGTAHQSSSAAAGQQWSSPTRDPAWWNPLDAEKASVDDWCMYVQIQSSAVLRPLLKLHVSQARGVAAFCHVKAAACYGLDQHGQGWQLWIVSLWAPFHRQTAMCVAAGAAGPGSVACSRNVWRGQPDVSRCPGWRGARPAEGWPATCSWGSAVCQRRARHRWAWSLQLGGCPAVCLMRQVVSYVELSSGALPFAATAQPTCPPSIGSVLQAYLSAADRRPVMHEFCCTPAGTSCRPPTAASPHERPPCSAPLQHWLCGCRQVSDGARGGAGLCPR